MDIIISQGNTSVVFPVLPESFDVKTAQGNTTVNINALGEVNLLGHANLETVSFSGFFPSSQETYTTGNVRDPMEYVTDIRSMKEKGPCELHLLDIQAMHCTIEEFDFGESDGTGDINFSIDLKQYVYINAEGIVNKQVSKIGRPKKETGAGTYIVKTGDNLFTIARRQLGTTDWQELYQINKETIGSNPNRIMPGMKLILPE